MGHLNEKQRFEIGIDSTIVDINYQRFEKEILTYAKYDRTRTF